MKLSRCSISIGSCLLLAVSSQAQLVTDVDWKFSVSGRTNNPTEVISNPSGATATATVFGNSSTYFFGAGPEGLFGTRTGLWDIGWDSGSGKMELGISLGAISVVEFTLKVTQFVGGPYSGLLSFNSPNVLGFTTASAQLTGQTVVEQRTGSMVGYWVQDTYTWSAMGAPGPIRLNIVPGNGTSSAAALFDEVELIIKGDLTSAPEPTSVQLLTVGLAAFALGRPWLRRKAKG